VGETVSAGDIVRAAESAERALVAKVGVFDVYRGEGVAEGAKSIAIHVTLQPRERTLTEAEIEAAISKIVAEVAKKTGATLRS
jgi:phenylalanyl-tRNA synthetase beta chain